MGCAQLLLLLCVGVTNIICCEAGTKCPLPWNANASLPFGMNLTAKCPYGYSIKGFDVTVPNDPTWLDRVCIVYGLIPYVIIGLAVLDAVGRGCKNRGLGTRSTIFLGFVGFQVLISEFILKKMVQQARPERSCNLTCGMPSSHSIMSVGFFVFMFLDASYRVMPSYPLDVASARLYAKSVAGKVFCCGFSVRDLLIGTLHAGFNVVPVADAHTLSHYDFVSMALFWGVLLLPVPFTRTVLFDHTPQQVTVGSIIGVLEAVAYFALVHRFFTTKYNHLVGQRICGIFQHNHGLPAGEAISRCCLLLVEGEDCLAEDMPDDELLEELIQKHNELNWYLTQLDPCCPLFMFDEDKTTVEHQRNILTQTKLQMAGMVQMLDSEATKRLIDEEELSSE